VSSICMSTDALESAIVYRLPVKISWHFIYWKWGYCVLSVSMFLSSVRNWASNKEPSLNFVLKLVKQVYGDDFLSRSRVHEWFQRFQSGREDINDDEHVGQPKSVITENSIETVPEFIKNQPNHHWNSWK